MTEPATITTPRPSRRVAFDIGRLLAAYAIVWLHTPRSATLEGTTVFGRFAVPFFVFATIFFVFESLRHHPERTFGRYTTGRILRIYVPFLAWCGIYLLFKGTKSLLLPSEPNVYPGIELLWTGSFYHLWFMPFILVVSLVAFLVAKVTLPSPRTGNAVATACFVVGVALAALPLPMTDEYEYLIFNATPAVLIGLSLAIVYGPCGKLIERRVTTFVGLVLFAGTMIALGYADRDRLLETFAGLGFTLVALAPLQNAWAARIARFGGLAYGIYLSHLLLIKTAEAVTKKVGIESGWELDLGIFLFAAAGSTLLAWLLSKCSLTKWLVV